MKNIFYKMHTCGNDFVIIDANAFHIKHEGHFLAISDRHFGIGCDQIILFKQSDNQTSIKIFNQNGTEAKMCCNGILALTKLMGILSKHKISEYNEKNDRISFATTIATTSHSVRVNYKNLISTLEINVPEIIKINQNEVSLNLGNKHKVRIINTTNANATPSINEHVSDMMENGYNLHIAYMLSDVLHVYSHENGVGKTLSCGSGEIAAATAMRALGHKNNHFTIKSMGGTSSISFTGQKSAMVSKKSSLSFYGCLAHLLQKAF